MYEYAVDSSLLLLAASGCLVGEIMEMMMLLLRVVVNELRGLGSDLNGPYSHGGHFPI